MDPTWAFKSGLERGGKGEQKNRERRQPGPTTARSVVLGPFEGMHTLMSFMRPRCGHSSGSRSECRCAPSLQRAAVSSLLPFDGTRTAQPRWPWYWLQSWYRANRSTSSHQRAITMTLGLEATQAGMGIGNGKRGTRTVGMQVDNQQHLILRLSCPSRRGSRCALVPGFMFHRSRRQRRDETNPRLV